MAEWIQTLPPSLKNKVQKLIDEKPEAGSIFTEIYNHIIQSGTNSSNATPSNDTQGAKRRKLGGAQTAKSGQLAQPDQPEQISEQQPEITGESGLINITSPINPQTIIFEIQLVSFQSPIRKRLNLTFHLIEQHGTPLPILSIVNPQTNIPEVSVINLVKSIKLCILIPILTNSTNSKKKMIVSLCFWLNDSIKSDPIVCQINLDLIKKNLVKLGKLPSNIDNQFEINNEDQSSINLNPIQETIIDYFTRQFKLCGINLVNYLPGTTIFQNKFTLNSDGAIACTRQGKPGLIICEAHKGAKEGCLLLLSKNEFSPAYIIFGFKKPILLYEVGQVFSKSYSNITRITFNLTFVIQGEAKPVEFSMIDQKFHNIIDEFLAENEIQDESFAQKLREKNDKQIKEEEEEEVSETAQLIGNLDHDDEDEEDDDFDDKHHVNDSSDDVAEEFDSDVGDTDDEDDNDVFQKGKEVEEGEDDDEDGDEEGEDLDEDGE